MFGGFGNDVMNGGDGNDFISGDFGNDTLNGGDGADFLLGGSDNDTLVGGDGGDLLYGGAGLDVMTGGDGSDRFIFGAADSLPVIAGAVTLVDIITDFRGINQGGTDRIDLTSIVSVVFQVTNVPGQGQLLEFAANNGAGPLNKVFLPGIGPLSNFDFDI